MQHPFPVCIAYLLSLILITSACSAQIPGTPPGAITKAATLDQSGADAAGLPTFKVQSVTKPVITSRKFVDALAPNPRGGWNWIGQYMIFMGTYGKERETIQLPSGQHYLKYKDPSIRPDAEWVIADLSAGKVRVLDMPGFDNRSSSALAGNGRLFFTIDYGQIYYYDPVDETIKILGRVHDDLNVVRFFNRFQLGPDGMIYGAAQSTVGTSSVLRLNPDTLEYKLITDVGTKGRRDLTYGYYLTVCPPWVYVGVGQGKWELWAVNMDTGEKKMLAERIQDDEKSRVIVGGLNPDGTVSAELHGPPNFEAVILDNGQIVARSSNRGEAMSYKGTPRNYPPMQWLKSKPVTVAIPQPELDSNRNGIIERDGSSAVYWRPAGNKGDFNRLPFAIQRAEAEGIESLLTLPDGSILGSIRQYNGWFRYDPQTGKCAYYGKGGPSRSRSVMFEGKVYFSGYPNAMLHVFDPSQPWNNDQLEKSQGNPHLIGSQGQTRSEAHYSIKMIAAGQRVYTLGRRERWSTGTGLCGYSPSQNDFVFEGKNNKDLDPVDIAALPKLGRIIVSGQRKSGTSLLVYDMDLKQVDTITLKPGLENTGGLLPVNDTQFLGWYGQAPSKKTVLYLYDLAEKKQVKSVELDGQVDWILQRPTDQTFWMALDGIIHRLDPTSLTTKPVAKFEGGMGIPTWVGKELYGRNGGVLVKLDHALP